MTNNTSKQFNLLASIHHQHIQDQSNPIQVAAVYEQLNQKALVQHFYSATYIINHQTMLNVNG